MRSLLFASAALLGLTGGFAYAQTMNESQGGREPYSARASNIESSDTRSTIAPALPSPNIGEDGTPDQYLRAAQDALQRRQTGLAQSSMEMAETRMLDRSVMPSRANEPDMAPGIRELHQARDALGRGDLAGASQLITEAMNARTSAGGNMGSSSMNAPATRDMNSPAMSAPPGEGSQAIQPGAPAPVPSTSTY
jgi:hypothetical protein